MMAKVKKFYKKVAAVKDNAALENEHEDKLDSINLHLINNFGIEVREVSFVEFERRKEPRNMLSRISIN